jgi:hypothetical protein
MWCAYARGWESVYMYLRIPLCLGLVFFPVLYYGTQPLMKPIPSETGLSRIILERNNITASIPEDTLLCMWLPNHESLGI